MMGGCIARYIFFCFHKSITNMRGNAIQVAKISQCVFSGVSIVKANSVSVSHTQFVSDIYDTY